MKADYTDIIGQKFSRLTVLSHIGFKVYSPNSNPRNVPIYECICECGNIVEKDRYGLTCRASNSCGCYRIEQSRKAGKAKKARRKKVECTTCGNMFPVPKCRENDAKYCSVVCANESFKRENKQPHRHIGYEYKEWRTEVLKRDNYTCIKCDEPKENMVAHHLLSFSKYEREKYNVDNGVTLCAECHNKFHKLYGLSDFTQINFIRWVK